MVFPPPTDRSGITQNRFETPGRRVDVPLPRPASSTTIRRRVALVVLIVVAAVAVQQGLWGSVRASKQDGNRGDGTEFSGPSAGVPSSQAGVEANGLPPDLDVGPEERAVAIAVPLAPLALEPGDTVDLIAVRADGTGGVVTEVLGEPVRVLAVSDRAVTVVASTVTATQIISFQAIGSVEMLLRLD